MIYENKEFKKYDDFYYISEDGDVYSVYKNGLLKHAIDHDGYHRVDIHGQHMKIHKLVYLTWHGAIPDGFQINHIDDDKNNNHYMNLYAGSQKQNIHDCMRNGHRKGNVRPITVLDKLLNQLLHFDSIKDFLSYTGHSITNGSLSHVRDKIWFKERFEII